jgi:toxin ParE1/3/4
MIGWRLGPDARDDLRAIYKYVGARNRTAASRLIDTIKSKLWLLARQPLLGEVRSELSVSLRSFTVGNYVIFYRPIGDGIQVARILHAARDVEAQFRPHDGVNPEASE